MRVKKREVFIISWLIIYMLFLNVSRLYQYLDLWSVWHCKVLYYIATSIFLIGIIIDIAIPYQPEINKQYTLICLSALAFNFICFALTSLKILNEGVLTIFILDIVTGLISIMILISGLRHGLFNK